MKFLTLVLFALLVTGARADTIDYVFQFSSSAQAQADVAIARYYLTNQGLAAWRGDLVFSNIQVWKPSQDQAITNPSPPPATFAAHQYLSGYFMIVSLPSPVVPAAFNDANILVIIDRDMASAGQSGSVLKNSLGSLSTLNQYQFSPIPAGANYPFGNFQ